MCCQGLWHLQTLQAADPSLLLLWPHADIWSLPFADHSLLLLNRPASKPLRVLLGRAAQASCPFRSATTTATLSVVYRFRAISTKASATACADLPCLN